MTQSDVTAPSPLPEPPFGKARQMYDCRNYPTHVVWELGGGDYVRIIERLSASESTDQIPRPSRKAVAAAMQWLQAQAANGCQQAQTLAVEFAGPGEATGGEAWIGCGECDSAFPCWNGEQRCLRLHPEQTDPRTDAFFATRATPPQPAADGWYCAHCQTGVSPTDVTYQETHVACGRVITNGSPPPRDAGKELITPAMARDLLAVLENWPNVPQTKPESDPRALRETLRALAGGG